MKTVILLLFIGFSMNSYSQTQFIAHRGASNLAPENTVASATKAWEIGADAVEVDIHYSKDKRIMVIHDSDTKRTCKGKKLEVQKTPSILLRDLDAGIFKGDEFKGEKIPFLSEIVKTVPAGKTLVVEVKCDDEVLIHLTRLFEKTGKLDQIVFIAFNWKTIVKTKEQFPNNKCYWLSALKPGLKKRMEQAAEIGLDGVNLRYSMIDEKVMSLAKELNLDVLTWTVDDPAEAKRLISIGVSGITTNRPQWLKEQLAIE